MPVSLKSTGGGSVTLDVGSTASTFTLTLPSATGTVATTASPTFSGTLTATTITSPAATALSIQSAGTTAMTVDTSQNVGIGTSSPGAKLEIATTNQSMKITGSGAANWTTVANTSRSFNYGVDATGFNIYDNTAASYRMIIDTSGNLLVGTTNALPINNRNNGFVIKSNGSWVARFPSSETDIGISTTSGNLLNFYSDNGSTAIYSGSISVNGNVTTYGSVSDYRLKEDVQPMVGGLNTISALSPVSYKWKDSDNCGEGFIAHDLQSVIPDAVIGDKDAVKDDGSPSYQQVDCSKIVVHLVAAIQELKADLDAAKAEIATLKGAA